MQLLFEAVRKHGGQGAGDLKKSEEAKRWQADLEVDRRELQKSSGGRRVFAKAVLC